MTHDTDGWRESEKLVMAELERLGTDVRSLAKEMGAVRVSIGKLEVKSGIWGAIGAAITLLIAKIAGKTL